MRKDEYRELFKKFHTPAATREEQRENFERAQMIIQIAEWRKDQMKSKAVHLDLTQPKIDKEITRLSKMSDYFLEIAEDAESSQAQRDKAMDELDQLQKQLEDLYQVRKVKQF
jgi:hypothetical protein